MPEINITSDDGILIQKVVRNGLISLAVAIIFLSGAALWTVTQLSDFYKNEVDIINKQEHLLHTMRITARERTLLMYGIVNEVDPFQRDDQSMAFSRAAAFFSQSRIKLLNTPLDDYQLILLENQGKKTGIARPRQEQVVDLALRGEKKLALDILREKAIPAQQQVMLILEQLYESLERRHSEIKSNVDSIGNVSITILISIVIIVIFSVLFIIRLTTNRLSSMISDQTETRNILQKTVYELIQQKEALDNHAIVSIADEYGNIVYANDKFCTVSGYAREELIGKNHRSIKSDMHSSEFFQDLWSTITQGHVWHGKVCNKRKDGSYYWVDSTITPFLDSSGKPYQYVSIRTDITDFLEAKIDAEKASRAKSIFMSSMSHELRTPMNAVLGFAQILEMQLEGDNLKSIKEIKNSGEHLMGLINDILDLSQIDVGKFQPFTEAIDIASLVKESLVSIQDMARNKNITVRLKAEDVSEVRILADRMRLKQAILNYLTNAVKFNHKDGEVIVGVEMIDSAKCRIFVKDSGIGLSKEQLTTIFNPFTKLDEHISLVEGSGLGLTITKRIIEMMNGKVGVESEVGKGSTFWIELPTE